MIETTRIKKLNSNNLQNNKFVIYWMQQSQRTKYNHSLEYALNLSNKYEKPLIVFFGLTKDFLNANLRHYTFMLQGLKEVKRELEKRRIKFVIKIISPEKGIIELSKKAGLIVVDRGYLKIQKAWRKTVADKIKCPLIQVESDVVVPVEEASEKEEFAARTIRPKILKKRDLYLKNLDVNTQKKDSLNYEFESTDISNIKKLLEKLNVDKKVKSVDSFIGGEKQAEKTLKDFLKNKIDKFHEERNDPNKNILSNISPYLHFGNISPVYISLEAIKTNSPGLESFLEELIVRRELSMNYVYYNPFYDSYKAIPNWAKTSLKNHEKDRREYIYNFEEFEKAETHDSYWNAAQKQMIKTGKMHGYMRMYWGKKIIEWTKKPQEAFEIMIYLNNKYELDGRDPNSYTGVSWCFGKHDRAWIERKIFGKIRYMNANGLKRKFDSDAYANKYIK